MFLPWQSHPCSRIHDYLLIGWKQLFSYAGRILFCSDICPLKFHFSVILSNTVSSFLLNYFLLVYFSLFIPSKLIWTMETWQFLKILWFLKGSFMLIRSGQVWYRGEVTAPLVLWEKGGEQSGKRGGNGKLPPQSLGSASWTPKAPLFVTKSSCTYWGLIFLKCLVIDIATQVFVCFLFVGRSL